MGRWCYFDNEFQYKFYCGVQDSGFDYLKEHGVTIGPYAYEHNFMLFLENNCEHLLCDANCDKPLKHPKDMIVVGGELFCDEECRANFTGEPCEDERICMKRAATTYEFICWAKEQGDTVRHEDAPYRDNDPFWNELLDDTLDRSNEIFCLDVDRNQLFAHLQSYGIDLPNFNDYTTDFDGLNKLYNDLDGLPANYLTATREQQKEIELQTSNFTLACLLYHMSADTQTITGFYQV